MTTKEEVKMRIVDCRCKKEFVVLVYGLTTEDQIMLCSDNYFTTDAGFNLSDIKCIVKTLEVGRSYYMDYTTITRSR